MKKFTIFYKYLIVISPCLFFIILFYIYWETYIGFWNSTRQGTGIPESYQKFGWVLCIILLIIRTIDFANNWKVQPLDSYFKKSKLWRFFILSTILYYLIARLYVVFVAIYTVVFEFSKIRIDNLGELGFAIINSFSLHILALALLSLFVVKFIVEFNLKAS